MKCLLKSLELSHNHKKTFKFIKFNFVSKLAGKQIFEIIRDLQSPLLNRNSQVLNFYWHFA